MPNSKQIVYLSQSQYAELIANGTITVDGVTVTYDENDIYVTPQAEPVTDVRVAGTSVAANGIAEVPIATTITAGVVKIGAEGTTGIRLTNNVLNISEANEVAIRNGTNNKQPITPYYQKQAVYYGLATAAGASNIGTSVGTYTPEAKGAIQQMLGVSDLIATAENSLVASKAYAVGDIFTANGKLYKVTTAIAADGAIVLQNEGETVSGANAIQCKLGEETIKDVRVNGVSVLNNGVANVPIAQPNDLGVVKYQYSRGMNVTSDGTLSTYPANSANIKSATHQYQPVVPYFQHESTFYGLAKAAGADEKDSTLPVGQYTDTAKAAIRSMLGAENGDDIVKVQDTEPTSAATKIWLPETPPASVTVPTVAEMEQALSGKVDDVQVNGVSVVTDGIANVPLASSSTPGVAKVSTSYGLDMANGIIKIYTASIAQCKNQTGSTGYQPLTVFNQHAAAFYGLAKAAGDATQSASSNAIGTYTDNAKASIKAMLGVQDGSTGTVNVSGTAPTIAAVENTRYVCGEVTSLSFTPPSSGISIVRFTSGSSVTVLTIPSTVKFPEWFDPTSLETNTIYEICITDGIYGAVMSWAL